MKQVKEGLDGMQSVMNNKVRKKKLYIDLFSAQKHGAPEAKHCTIKVSVRTKDGYSFLSGVEV